jgi:hypothetical protein
VDGCAACFVVGEHRNPRIVNVILPLLHPNPSYFLFLPLRLYPRLHPRFRLHKDTVKVGLCITRALRKARFSSSKSNADAAAALQTAQLAFAFFARIF